jgi:hypothetical protein
LQLFNNYTGQYKNYAKILVLQDAYQFVRSLDVLIGEFTAENFEQKLQIPGLCKKKNFNFIELKLMRNLVILYVQKFILLKIFTKRNVFNLQKRLLKMQKKLLHFGLS